jgi:exosortase/archaeosortase
MPLSEEELRILQEIEANLTATDPALVQQVSETTLYRHAARSIKWAIFGFVCGLVLLVATFTKVLVLGMVGFLVMLACLLVIERNARKMERTACCDIECRSATRVTRLSSFSGMISSYRYGKACVLIAN